MSKFHISADGIARKCTAKRVCPLGGDDVHFATKKDAQEYSDSKNEKEHSLLPEVNKSEWDLDFKNVDEMQESEIYQSINKRFEDAKRSENKAKQEFYKVRTELEQELSIEYNGAVLGFREDAYYNIPDEELEDIKAKVFKGNPKLARDFENSKVNLDEAKKLTKKAEDLYEKLIVTVLENAKISRE